MKNTHGVAVPDAWLYTRTEDGEKVLAFEPTPGSMGKWVPLFKGASGEASEEVVAFRVRTINPPGPWRYFTGDTVELSGEDEEVEFLKRAPIDGVAPSQGAQPLRVRALTEGEHRDLMLLAASDLESWMKSYHCDTATDDLVRRLRDAAAGVTAF